MKPSLTRMAQPKSCERKAMRHRCSAVPSTLDFVNIGVDVFNPIQASDAHMDPEGIGWDFGDAASFRGDVQTSLASGPHGQVEVERLLNRPGPRGRTVCCYGSASEARGAQVVCFAVSSPDLSDPHRYLTDGAGVTISHTPTFEPHRPRVRVQGLISRVQDWCLRWAVFIPISRNNFTNVDPLQKFDRYGVTLPYGGQTMEV